jgi:hypothetical protein
LNDSQETDEEEDEDDEDEIKEEKDDNGVVSRSGVVGDKEELKRQIGEAVVEKGKHKRERRKSNSLHKEILAVVPMPKMKTLKKNRRAKVTQTAAAFDWKLPIYTTQPFPHEKSEEKKKRKREDPARFMLQMKPSFEEGSCALDECVFEDMRGTQISNYVARKFTIRKIMRSICKQLWNSTYAGVLTNGRRRSLYESNTFEKKLRDVCGEGIGINLSNFPHALFFLFFFLNNREEHQQRC